MFPCPFSLGLSITFLSFSPGLSINLSSFFFFFFVQCANPVTKLYETFRGNLRWLYSLTKYSLLQLSRPVLTSVSGFSASLHVSFSVNRTYRLNSPPIMQGLSVPFACLGSGDPVRVLHLYTTNTLDIL